MNENVFNTQNNPIYVVDNIDDGYYEAVRLGNAYITTANSGGLLSINNYLALGITNQSGSGKNIFIQEISVVAAGVNLFGQVTIAQGNTTISNNATPTSFVNANLGLGTTNSVAQIKMSTQGTNPGGTPIEVVTQVNSIYTNTYSGGILVSPNTKLTVYIQNTVGVATAMYIRISFWEENI